MPSGGQRVKNVVLRGSRGAPPPAAQVPLLPRPHTGAQAAAPDGARREA